MNRVKLTLFATLKLNHYCTNEMSLNYRTPEYVLKEIGYPKKWLDDNPAYGNTCAIRMSLALIKSQVGITGPMIIKAGDYKGYTIEPTAILLALKLVKKPHFGYPHVYPSDIASEKMAGKKGMVYFDKISGYGGGHIDLIAK